MKIISTTEIQESVRKVSPSHIAVAYIGADWESYVNSSTLEEIIVSPTIGSNPFAIQRAVNLLGWDRVHFLPNLHTKLYIGEKSAAFGSFNLSRNGITAEGLEEFGATTQNPTHLKAMRDEFFRLRKQAITSFPTNQLKKESLQQLIRITQQFNHTGITLHESQPISSLESYTPLTNHDFIVSWYYSYTPPINQEVIASTAPEISLAKLLNNDISYITLLEDDDIKPADWILLWRATKSGMPDRNTNPFWINIGSVIPKGSEDDPYTKIAVEYLGPQKQNPPFQIDSRSINAIRTALASDQLSALRPHTSGKRDWSIKSSHQHLELFIEIAKAIYRNSK
jgi:hypothetical protein